MLKEQGKEEGGPWDCYSADHFYGWEAERVVALTNGFQIMELITRAKTRLFVILVGNDQMYAETKANFQQAAELGLVDKLMHTN